MGVPKMVSVEMMLMLGNDYFAMSQPIATMLLI